KCAAVTNVLRFDTNMVAAVAGQVFLGVVAICKLKPAAHMMRSKKYQPSWYMPHTKLWSVAVVTKAMAGFIILVVEIDPYLGVCSHCGLDFLCYGILAGHQYHLQTYDEDEYEQGNDDTDAFVVDGLRWVKSALILVGQYVVVLAAMAGRIPFFPFCTRKSEPEVFSNRNQCICPFVIDHGDGKQPVSRRGNIMHVLTVLGASGISHFEISCWAHGGVPTIYLFRRFYLAISLPTGWIIIEKRHKRKNTIVPACHTEPFDSLKGRRDLFFWVNASVASIAMRWFDRGEFSQDSPVDRIAPTPIAFVIGLLNCVSIERRGGTAPNQGRSTCPRFEEFDDWTSLQKISELVDLESAGLEESKATRIFNGFESLLIPGGWPNSIEFAIRRIISFGSSILTDLPEEELGTRTKRSENHLNGGIDCISSFVPHSNWGSKSTKFDDLLRERRSKSMLLKTLQDMSGRPPLIVYEQNTSPKASKGVIQMDQEKIRSVLDWEVPKKERAGSSGGERQDGFKENIETPSVWSARPAELAAEEIRIDQLKIEECTLWT
nr:transposase (putative), gypsy type [Tanacetum cinerariifolium]